MKYFLLSSQRSGSALLKHALINLFHENDDGPDEWIVHPDTRIKLGLPNDLAEAKKLVLSDMNLLYSKMSNNSHRKIMYSQIVDPKRIPKSIPIIHLIRKDAWSQAKSSWIMREGILPAHINKDSDRYDKEDIVKIKLDHQRIKLIAQKMLNMKELWYQSLKNRPNTLTLFYENDLNDSNVFVQKTIPKIEEFLGKKSDADNFNFNLKKTRDLYTIENLNDFDETNLQNTYYFNPDKINKLNYIKSKLKLILKK